MRIAKRNGGFAKFDSGKIVIAIEKAMAETEVGVDNDLSSEIAGSIEDDINESDTIPTVESIQDMVEEYLMDSERKDVARRYILYRAERNALRKEGWQMDELQRDIYEKKYRLHEENFDQFLDRVSANDVNIKKVIRDKKFLPAGRILAGRGLNEYGKNVTLSNCYVMPKVEDTIESIFDTAKYLARTYSYGGGCGLTISNLRPKGAKVQNSAQTTTGATSFMDLYSMVTGLIGQRGRRGALMLNMDVCHPDIEEFIDIKNHDTEKVRFANISVNMTHEFMEAVEKNTDFELRFEVEATGEVISKVVDAKELFMKLAENNWKMAEPGILFWDNITDWHMMSEDPDFEFAGVNPCVSGDTLILTDKGNLRIDSLVGHEVNLWNGFEYSKVTPKITGYNQKMKLIKFSNGSELKTTHYHKFILKDGTRIEANQLRVGDKLAKWNLPVISGAKEISEKLAYTQGFYVGDGSLEKKRGRVSIKLCGEKRDLLDKLEYERALYCESFDGEFLTLEKNTDKFNKKFVPNADYTIESRLHWLAGYLDSDGTLQSSDGGFSISSTDKFTLSNVQAMLTTLGCHSSISVMHEAQDRMMPANDGTGALKLYSCQESYRLLISAYNVKKLIDLGLTTHRLPMISDPNRDASRFISVVSIEDTDDCETVYCFNEPKNHSGIFNGVMTAQCAEETLPAFGSCNLSSINLSNFVKHPFSEDAEFDFEEFDRVVKLGVIYLNDILDENMYNHPLPQQTEVSRDLRQIGLGIFGLADMFLKLGIKYGSQESVDISEKVSKAMLNSALQKSAVLAAVDGPFPKYNKDAMLKSPFLLKNATQETLDMISKYGLRNSQILTIAPTGSTSTMLGYSGGIEPIFQNSYTRRSETLHEGDVYYKVFTPIVKDYMDSMGITDEKDLPDYFVASSDLHYKNRIDVQAAWQRCVDASISSTVNLPNEATVEDIADLYMYAHKKGLKGITVYRDGCSRGGVLITEPKDEGKQGEDLDCST